MFQNLSSALFSFFIVFVVCEIASAAGAIKWDWRSNEYGINKWAHNFPNCNGSHQSPIDIKSPTYDSGLGEIQFTNYDTDPTDVIVTVRNDGHTYIASFTGFTNTTTPKISGGGLPGEFEIAQFHFHWGSNNNQAQGSEHLLYGMAYPAELHLVHLNTKYSETSEVLSNADGIAVLGVFIKQGEHNDKFNFLNLTEHNVTYQGMESDFSLATAFMNFLPSNKSFYRYNGSLTTPECQEVVTWTVFAEHIEISEAQLNVLRDLMYKNFENETEPLVNTYRLPQPLNGRTVLANFEVSSQTTATPTPRNTNTPSPSNASRIAQNYAMFVASLFLVVLSFMK